MRSRLIPFQSFCCLLLLLLVIAVDDVNAQENLDTFNTFAQKEIQQAKDDFFEQKYHLAVPTLIELKEKRSRMSLKTLMQYSDLNRIVYVKMELFKEAKEAIDYYVKAAGSEDPLLVSKYKYSNYEMITYAEKDYKKAIEFAEANCDLLSENMLFVAGKWNNIGIYYQEMGGYELAERYFTNAQNRLDSMPEIATNNRWELKTAINDNIAKNHHLRKNWDAAFDQYLKNQVFLDSLPINSNLVNNRFLLSRLVRTDISLAYLYMERGNNIQAKQCLLLADSLAELGSKSTTVGWSKHVYPLLNNAWWKYYNTIKDSENAEKYHLLIREDLNETSNKLKEAISSIGRLYRLQYDQHLISEDQISNKNKLLEAEKTKNWIVMIISALLLIGLIIYFIANRLIFFRKKAELVSAKLQIETLEVEKLNTALDYSKKDFKRLALIVERKEVLLKKLMEHEEEISELTSGENKVMNTLIEDIQNELIVDRDTLDYQIQANIVSMQFYETLERIHPGISELNKELCAQILMKLSLKQIAILRGVNPSSVSVAKARLKKSFGLEVSDDFYQYLSNLNNSEGRG